jgi:cell division protein FtsW (lipid II flippase)
VPQARDHAGPVVVVVMITVAVMVITVIVVVLVAATVVVVVVVTVIQVRAVHGVHDIQNARINALPHIDKYQGRALANCPQYARVAGPGDHERQNVKKRQVRELSRWV